MTACGSSSGSSGSGVGSPAIANSSSKSAYAGTWVRPCEAALNSSSRQKLIITDSKADLVVEMFAGTACSGSSLADMAMSTDYAIRSDVLLPGGAKALDLTLKTFVMVSRNADLTAKLNTDNYCGLNNWVTGQEKNIIGTSCSTATSSAVGKVAYSSIKLDGNKLFLGKSSDTSGESEATREVELETIAFIKQ